MLERYSEQACRVIFFARYEASQYGSAYIESEHVLLGLLREDPSLVREFLGQNSVLAEIRTTIESQIARHERFGVSVEVPLTEESRKILKLSTEEADRFASRYIETCHIFLALLRVESSLASRVLRQRGLRADEIRARLAKTVLPRLITAQRGSARALDTLHNFLAEFKLHNWEQLCPFFAENAQFVDATGKRWKGRAEIEKQFQSLFAPYAKKNVPFLIEGTDPGPADSCVASVLWENVSVGTQPRSMHRMTIILTPENKEWTMSLIQVTPVLL